MTPVRFHHLKAMALSPAHCKLALDGDETEPSTAMLLGTAVNDILLGGNPVLCYPDRRAGNDWKAFERNHLDATILNTTDYDRAMRMSEAVARNRDATNLLNGMRQQRLLWSQLGRPCRGTPDVRGLGYVTDLKTCRTAHPGWFTHQALRMNYHAQLAFYSAGVEALKIDTRPTCYIVAVESSAPYPVTILRLTDRAIEKGHMLIRLWMEQLLACEAANQWPGYCQSAVDLDVPDDMELTFAEEAA